ncbi:MAG: DUF3810 domain-containing protein [Firmicutes bacterium]|nr:DUF3810 domain-containing protein [Bacillota bacterium]
MKYWRGYITAAIFALATWGLMQFAEAHSSLADMVYPYVTRLIQDFLAEWSSGVDFCLWQMLAVLLGVLFLASIVIMIILRWNVFQWFGWVLACGCTLFFLHTGIYGLNQYCSSLAEDIRLTVQTGCTVTELAEATTYFRDMANQLATQVERDADGSVAEQDFASIAELAGDGFETLTYEYHYAVFAGSTLPVKELGWADMYTAMGITGVTMPLTGEAAVNPNTPTVALPFTMCHEMSHRMCIAQERDANLAAYLACTANSDPLYQYSGYFMAFRYCYNALATVTTTTAVTARQEIYAGISDELMQDLTDYREYYRSVQDEQAVSVANSVNDTYIKVSGDDSGTNSYGEVTDLLVSWHIQNIWLPAHQEADDEGFDPLDKNQVDLG